MGKIKRVIVCVMGKSACGKSTSLRALKEFDDYGAVNLVKSFTTRGIRESDPYDEETHTYVTEDKFIKDRDNGDIISLYTSPSGYHSWITNESLVYDKMNFMAIDIKAFNKLAEERQDDFIIKGFYYDIDEEERKRRYIKRNGSDIGFSREEHLELPEDYNKELITRIDCVNEIPVKKILLGIEEVCTKVLAEIFRDENGEIPDEIQEHIQHKLQKLKERG